MPKLCLQNIQILLPCEPFKVIKSTIRGNDSHIYFEYAGTNEDCQICKSQAVIHCWREIDLIGPPIGLHKRSVWHVKYPVFKCKECGKFFTSEIPFRFKKTSCTTYLAKLLCDDLQCHNETIKQVAARYHLKWDRVKNIHKEFLVELKKRMPKPQGPEYAIVDEFSIKKGQKYATLVINGKTKEPLFICKGNSAQDFRKFFEAYEPEFYNNIKAFAMDQNASYSSVVRDKLPNCSIVCDYFHMMENYNDQVVDPVRKRIVYQSAKDKNSELYNLIKYSRRLLTKRFKEGSTDKKEVEAKATLDALLEKNMALDTCVHMRELLQELYDKCRDKESMRQEWRAWCEMAKVSMIPELMSYAKKKARREEEIVNHAEFPISSGKIEGCMNKIKVIKRVSFGFRDLDYFFLRIWHTFIDDSKREIFTNQIWKDYGCNDENLELKGVA